ncbi:MAG TPA: cold shock domain-containing protein [Candidatus Nanoarchaeia archaeon]|nr:cold shock domain-containing protein [Candidatus Nanoarchaeia archaeon]
MEGKVKFYNRKKGFGFVTGDDGNDYFVHFTALPQGTFLRDGDKVSFETAESDRGLKAQNVQLLQKASEMEGAQPERRERSNDSDEESEEESYEG